MNSTYAEAHGDIIIYRSTLNLVVITDYYNHVADIVNHIADIVNHIEHTRTDMSRNILIKSKHTHQILHKFYDIS